jgi:ABC-2 type transport system ATP-binding protein
MSLVEINGLCRSFGDVHAVRDVTFAFDAGEILGFIGPNGAGKSTTMRILATLDLPGAGDCRVAGLSTVDDADAVRRMIGYMPDSYGSYPDMTVREYLDFFARAHGLAGAARRQAVEDVVEFCQMGLMQGKEITGLSKGMKQRLCLGRCIIHDPQVLILDEPSAGLDPRARIEFRDLLRALAARGKAILVSSHILSELEELCHQVAIIEQGRLVASGQVEAVKAQARSVRDSNADAPKSRLVELHLTVAEPRLERVLAEQPGVTLERAAPTVALVRVEGGDEAQARLLRALIAADLPVCACIPRDADLEDAFMHLTEGRVQ